MTAERPSPYSDEFLTDVRQRLLWSIEHLRGDYRRVSEQALQPSGQDEAFESPATYGSETYMQELDLAVVEGEAMELRQLEEALARIDAPQGWPFGMCEACVEQPQHLCGTCPWIAEERLRFLPWATQCVPIQERLEQNAADADAGPLP